MDIRTVGVMWNPKKSAGLPVARRVINVLEKHDVALRLDAGLASAFRREQTPAADKIFCSLSSMPLPLPSDQISPTP